MDKSRQPLPNSQPAAGEPAPGRLERRPTGCPYLGIKADPQTRFSDSSPGNFCHRVSPPESVALDHQERACLTETYPTCQVYDARWRGGLPAALRGEDGEGWSSNIVGGLRERLSRPRAARPASMPPEGRARLAPAEPPAEAADVETFRRLHEQARSQYARYPGGAPQDPAGAPEPAAGNQPMEIEDIPARRREDRLQPLWIALLLVGLLVISFSIWSVFRRLEQTNLASQNAQATAQVAISLVTAAHQTQEAGAVLTQVAAAWTPTPLPSTATPTATVPSPAEETAVAEATQAASATQLALALAATQTASASCEDSSGYPVEIVLGPSLTPPLGTVYNIGGAVPSPQAVWSIKNTGICDWTSLSLMYPDSETLLAPIIRKDGEQLNGSKAGFLVRPGEQVDIALAFNGTNAYRIRTEFLFVINGIKLYDRPALTLDVTGWILTAGAPNTPVPTKEKVPEPPPARSSATPPTRP